MSKMTIILGSKNFTSLQLLRISSFFVYVWLCWSDYLVAAIALSAQGIEVHMALTTEISARMRLNKYWTIIIL